MILNYNEEIPLLFIDVNLGDGLKPRIAMYENDSPDEVAASFAKKHSILDC